MSMRKLYRFLVIFVMMMRMCWVLFVFSKNIFVHHTIPWRIHSSNLVDGRGRWLPWQRTKYSIFSTKFFNIKDDLVSPKKNIYKYNKHLTLSSHLVQTLPFSCLKK
ncbi:hypothetical protein BpHYR1_015702 [Brachionus plicatilis]|uniref:Uncharacterized protein n=1 Tax=Brachionus plicatilis TaxID=10195 RepID=A0A3M7RFR0_BRAPC|nr:hypothetical protein BpHYR1_015702 [Brachionus plicatilis]